MNKYKLSGIVLIVLLSLMYKLNSQDCNNFFESKCVMTLDWNYEINSQSKNIPMYQGQTIKFSAVFYEGYEYSIIFCAQEGIGTVQYRLISTDIYLDKSFNSYNRRNLSQVVFYNESTRIILIEVKIQRTESALDTSNKKCMGIIIGEKKTDEYY